MAKLVDWEKVKRKLPEMVRACVMEILAQEKGKTLDSKTSPVEKAKAEPLKAPEPKKTVVKKTVKKIITRK